MNNVETFLRENSEKKERDGVNKQIKADLSKLKDIIKSGANNKVISKKHLLGYNELAKEDLEKRYDIRDFFDDVKTLIEKNPRASREDMDRLFKKFKTNAKKTQGKSKDVPEYKLVGIKEITTVPKEDLEAISDIGMFFDDLKTLIEKNPRASREDMEHLFKKFKANVKKAQGKNREVIEEHKLVGIKEISTE